MIPVNTSVNNELKVKVKSPMWKDDLYLLRLAHEGSRSLDALSILSTGAQWPTSIGFSRSLEVSTAVVVS